MGCAMMGGDLAIYVLEICVRAYVLYGGMCGYFLG